MNCDSLRSLHYDRAPIFASIISCETLWCIFIRSIFRGIDLLCEQLQNRNWDRLVTLPWHGVGQQERFNICSVVFELLAFCSYTSKGNWQFSREHAYYEVPCYLWQQRFTGSHLLITTTQPCTDTFQYFTSKSRGCPFYLPNAWLQLRLTKWPFKWGDGLVITTHCNTWM